MMSVSMSSPEMTSHSTTQITAVLAIWVIRPQTEVQSAGSNTLQKLLWIRALKFVGLAFHFHGKTTVLKVRKEKKKIMVNVIP